MPRLIVVLWLRLTAAHHPRRGDVASMAQEIGKAIELMTRGSR